MGILGNLAGQKQAPQGGGQNGNSGGAPEKGPDANALPEGKYGEPCSLCNAPGTDKKWAGKYWHIKCIRRMKKVGRGML